MKIYGPYIGTGGRHIIIKYNNGKRTTHSYARYLMEEKLGRQLTKDEQVDHIDGDFTNNNLSNLQILGRKEHDTKTRNQLGTWAEKKEFTCPQCKLKFMKDMRNYRFHNIKHKCAGPFCSKRCAGLYSTGIQYGKIKK